MLLQASYIWKSIHRMMCILKPLHSWSGCLDPTQAHFSNFSLKATMMRTKVTYCLLAQPGSEKYSGPQP